MPYFNRDGSQLFYTQDGQDGPPLLFVHGLACNHSHFQPQMQELAAHYRVVAVDLRGHGESAPLGPTPSPNTRTTSPGSARSSGSSIRW